MAATVQIHCFTGPAGATINILNRELRHKRADDPTADLSSPFAIPDSGTSFGWQKSTKIYVASNLGTQVGKIKWFADPAPDDWANSMQLYARTRSTYTQGSSADELTQVASTTNVDTYTAASPLVVNSAANAITSNMSYGNQDYVVQQVGILSTATGGIKSGRRCVYRYTEI